MVVNPLEDTCAGLRRAEALLRNGLYTPQFHAALQGRRPGDHVYAALGENAGGSWSDRVSKRTCRPCWPTTTCPRWTWRPWAPALEGRCPFLDFDVIELAMRMPERMRFQRRQAERAAAPVGPSLPAGGGHRPPQARVQCPDRSVVPPRLARPDRAVHPGPTWSGAAGSAARPSGNSWQIMPAADHGELLWALLILELWVQMAVEGTVSPEGSV